MSRAARDRAERCFALARSTTFEGERANAIAQGTRIAETAGLSLDDFDIPGRERQRRRQPGENVQPLTVEQINELMRKMAEVLNARFDASYMSAYYNPAPRPPRYCPHGSDMALFGESCVMCERERRSAGEAVARCKMCGEAANESRFGAPCYNCVPFKR